MRSLMSCFGDNDSDEEEEEEEEEEACSLALLALPLSLLGWCEAETRPRTDHIDERGGGAFIARTNWSSHSKPLYPM